MSCLIIFSIETSVNGLKISNNAKTLSSIFYRLKSKNHEKGQN